MSGSENAIVERLDRLITLLTIAHGEALGELRSKIGGDPVASRVLETAAEDWVASGDLKRTVANAAGVSEKTVQRSIASLCELGLLLTQGSSRSTSHKSSGVI